LPVTHWREQRAFDSYVKDGDGLLLLNRVGVNHPRDRRRVV